MAESHRGLWLCTHEDTCIARMRHASLRGPTSPDSGRPIAVVGSRPASRDRLAAMLADLTAADVDRLDLDMRGLTALGRRDYGMALIDLYATDPVALVNGATRRLTPLHRRGARVIVVTDPGAGGPAVETLSLAAATDRISRPVEPADLLAILVPDGDGAPGRLDVAVN